ncbi:Neuralized-Like Protein 4 [Manis pentadactyla]|nr:Neuralized-Like Protein 4 [Manis pentadactyla]
MNQKFPESHAAARRVFPKRAPEACVEYRGQSNCCKCLLQLEGEDLNEKRAEVVRCIPTAASAQRPGDEDCSHSTCCQRRDQPSGTGTCKHEPSARVNRLVYVLLSEKLPCWRVFVQEQIVFYSNGLQKFISKKSVQRLVPHYTVSG